MPSWYVKVTAFRDRMVELNKGIDWVPAHVKDGIFGNWLANARDWNIGRNRFWGAPIPVWKSDDPDYPRIDCYGSLDEIERDFGVRPKDLHRPYVDDLTRPNPDDPTGKSTMRRVEDVLDCWFESGSMPFCQVHYPFENKEWFDSHFPGDFIVEYVGQTRGWFYTLMVMSTALFDKAPFRSCICHGVVLDENKQKLSKRLKNYPDPVDVFNTYGADALRWYMVSSPLLSGGDLAMPKDGKAIGEAVRAVLLPIWNAYSFFTLYANIDGIKGKLITTADGRARPLHPRQDGRARARASRRRWTGSTSPRACNALPPFIEALNNWYIRRSRDRFWKSGEGRRQARRLRHALHRARHADADDGAVPAVPHRAHPPRAGRTARACICRIGRTRRPSRSTRRWSSAWTSPAPSARRRPRSAPRRISATACRSAS